jgi:ribosome-associated protein
MDLPIDDHLTLPAAELRYTTSRSSGPGGQNVNKVESRVSLRFSVAQSQVLTPEQKERIFAQLGSRIDKSGTLQVSSQRHRTQAANRQQAGERLAELLREALAEDAERRPTRVPPRVRRRRLEEKRRRSQVKRLRSGEPDS